AFSQEPFHPGNKVPGSEAPRRLWSRVIVLGYDHKALLVNVQPELDRVGKAGRLGFGSHECGCPFVMNDCVFHIQEEASEPQSSLASFHAIYALQPACYPFFASFAQVSFNVIVRLKTSRSNVLDLSKAK